MYEYCIINNIEKIIIIITLKI